MEELANDLLPLAAKIAREFANIPGLPHAEIELAAQEALAHAARLFDPAILLALRPRLEAHHGVALDESALRAAVEWSVRYLPDFRLPDKALDLVDQACAAVRFKTLTPQVLAEEKNRGETPLGRTGARRASHLALHVGRSGISGRNW
jgi:AAA lid domain